MKKIFIFILSVSSVIFLSSLYETQPIQKKYHSAGELREIQNNLHAVPIDSNEYFLTAQRCRGCHGYDLQGLANVNEAGEDVNLYDDWETSMMGLSAMDPLWRAKVSHEVAVNPGHSGELQTLCTSCHSPMGHYTAMFRNQAHYTLNDMYNDSLGKNGVSCMSCHSIKDEGLGTRFTGNIPYDTNNVANGPFPGPMIGPMQLYVGLIPQYAPHVSEGNFCSPCHTLISNTVDLQGNATGGTFVEQATYHEWVNSSYPQQGITCQTCHMPKIEDPVKIANGYIALPGRTPFNKHSFAGANSYMVNLMKQNKTQLGIDASDANFDSTLTAIDRLLKQSTLDVNTEIESVAQDTLSLNVELLNKAGHKFPSGYPARRAVLQVVALKENGDTLFASGLFDANGEFINVNDPYEPHYTSINNPSQVQVYEMIMSDVNGNRTTVLERSSYSLKDNRIPPVGFTTQHSTYDTAKIVGGAFDDSNFNKVNGIEGSGKDLVNYKISLGGYQGNVNVFAKVYYQSVPAYWMSEMFNFSSPEISAWQNYYNASNKTPIYVSGDSIQNINVTTFVKNKNLENFISIFPNPSFESNTSISFHSVLVERIEVFETSGKLVYANDSRLFPGVYPLVLGTKKGTYFIKIKTNNGVLIKKVLKL